MKKFWSFKASAEPRKAELMLYGDISSVSWYGDEVTPKQFQSDLDACGEVDELHVHINSDGGDVFAGHAIHSMLRHFPAKKIVHIDGLAASIASVIAMAGDEVIMPVNSMLMLHKAWTIGIGNADDFRALADELDKIGESLIAAYAEKSGLSNDEIVDILKGPKGRGTWLTAQEAKEKGFADVVESKRQVAASLNGNFLAMNGLKFDLEKYIHGEPEDVVVVEINDELPTNPPIVEDEVEPITDERVAEAVNRIMNETTLTRHDAITVATVAIAVYDAGRVLSAANENDLRSARDLVDGVLSKVASGDESTENRVEMALAEFKPDERIDTVLNELKSLREVVDAIKASFSDAQNALRNVVDNKVTSSSSTDEVVINDEEHVITLDDAAPEANIEVDSLKDEIKAAMVDVMAELKEEAAEWRLRNTGKID